MKTLYDNEVFNEEFILKWHAGKKKLDSKSKLKDRTLEKKFKEQINPFIDWLK